MANRQVDTFTENTDHCRTAFKRGGTVVVKIGSSLLIDGHGQPRVRWMETLAAWLARRQGPVVIVCSGAIALGRGAIGLQGRPNGLAEAQAAAAVGQIQLAQLWSDVLGGLNRVTAQLLLTLGDLEDRRRYLNARNTLEMLLARDVVPVINENDTVATDEIRFGDNDRLAARVAQMAGADLLILLSDVDGLYRANPWTTPNPELVTEVVAITPDIEQLAGSEEATEFGTGGMVSKLAAAKIATSAGCPVLLTSGSGDVEPLARYFSTGRGTFFKAAEKPLVRRKQWLRSLQHHVGTLHLDAGACRALAHGASLLTAGVQKVDGRFKQGGLVVLRGPDGLIGQGLCGYNSEEADKLVGVQTTWIEQVLGYSGRGPIVHRDDLVLF